MHAPDLKQDLIAQVIELIDQRLNGVGAGQAKTFAALFYQHVPPDDLIHCSADTLYGSALSLWYFASAFKAGGGAKMRVYNPDPQEHAWQSDHTVIEIVNTDMPFLVDSVTAALNDLDLTVHLVIHPIVRVRRDKQGVMEKITGLEESDAPRESIMHVQIDEQTDQTALAAITEKISSVLEDVRLAVEDWRLCRDRVLSVLTKLETTPPDLPEEEINEAKAFLSWVYDDHFTFLGYREYDYTDTEKLGNVVIAEEKQLGILRRTNTYVFEELRNLGEMPPDVQAFARQPKLLLVTKANKKATVHRPVQMDIISVKKFNETGQVTGQQLFIGLFTSVAYNLSLRQIPLLRMKVEETIAKANFPPASHAGKALVNILETFPRDELFQIDSDDLYRISTGILHLQERQRIALFTRRDAFERFVSCIVYCPRDRFTTRLRRKFQTILADAINGEVQAHYTQIGDSPLARLYVIVKTRPGTLRDYDIATVENRLTEAAQDWSDLLKAAVIAGFGEEKGLQLHRTYSEAFNPDYRERFAARAAVIDIERVETVIQSREIGVSLYQAVENEAHQLRFKIYHPNTPVPLSKVLPMLENMGLTVITELPYDIHPRDAGGPVMIHDFGCEVTGEINVAAVSGKVQDLFVRVWRNEVENDGFNRLVLLAGIEWRQVVMLRAYSKYLRQTGIPFSQDYMENTLARNPTLSGLIVTLFELRFLPDRSEETEIEAAATLGEIHTLLEAVDNPDEDRILRRFLNLVLSTLRTNYYRLTGAGEQKSYISFKFESASIEELPLPRPWREIFVYSPEVEAVHLRGGPVARGGIRWSDRREDFRTEVLGLVKAQMVKNAVIVPVGSKGGFVVKNPPQNAGREDIIAHGIECYKTLMRGLLDITDNIVGGDVVSPRRVVCIDGDDPYLVVAADKGTATFSDIANQVAADYGFWLDDAFASGGSHGYDHKKMGITARGAWESVKRHFREIGKDIQSEPFTVIGVGDMSGDVFGNGMLLSGQIRLQGAFNHLHIFVDPDPDPAASFAERKRLFGLPRSSWADYNEKRLSKGGRIYERRAKNLTLTPEIKTLTGLTEDKVTPAQLIQALLKAPAELLWFGGIGTYLKSQSESDGDVGDRANDAVRINADEARVKVIGEGANLGCTQRARIEAARNGIRLNTDAIDNAGGVNCSDHEVNIKILLGEIVGNGDMTAGQRNRLLEQMTDEVADLVLRDTYLQSQAITIIQSGGPDVAFLQARMIRDLEKAGRLNRELEFLPDDEELSRRLANGEGLTRPEISVLMPYAKIRLYDELLASEILDDPFLESELKRYFPTPLQKTFAYVITNHRLRREIIATVTTNSLINRVGGTFVHQMHETTGQDSPVIVRAYIIARSVFNLRRIWSGIEALDNTVPTALQTAMLTDTVHMLEGTTRWFLHHGPHPELYDSDLMAEGPRWFKDHCPSLNMSGTIREFQPVIGKITDHFEDVIGADAASLNAVRQKAQHLTDQGVGEELARQMAALPYLISACDITRISQQNNTDPIAVGRVYFAIGARFQLGALRAAAEAVDAQTHWQKLARQATLEDLYAHQRDLTRLVLDQQGAKDSGALIDAWVAKNQTGMERSERLISELRAAGQIDLAMLAVANRQIRTLCGG